MSLLAVRSAARAVLHISRTAVPRTLAGTAVRVGPVAAAIALRGLSTSAARADIDSSVNMDASDSTPAQRTSGSPGRTIFLGNLPWTITPNDIASQFYKFGEIEDIRIVTDSTGRPRGIGNVIMSNEADAIKAVETLQKTPVFINGRHLRCEFALAGTQREAVEANLPPTDNLMMFEYDGDESAVQNMFSAHLKGINRIHIVRDRETGLSRRTVFIEFYTVDAATAAINDIREQYPDQRIRFATPRQPGGGQGDRRPRNNGQGGGFRTGSSW